MALFEGGGLLFLGLIVFWLWALYDVITVEPSRSGTCRRCSGSWWSILLGPFFALGAFLVGVPRSSARAPAPPGGRRRRAARAVHRSPSPAADMHANRVVTDRRSAELDRMLEEWERTRRGESKPES